MYITKQMATAAMEMSVAEVKGVLERSGYEAHDIHSVEFQGIGHMSGNFIYKITYEDIGHGSYGMVFLKFVDVDGLLLLRGEF